MIYLRVLLLFLLVALPIASPAFAVSPSASNARVDPQIWAALQESPDRRAAFALEMDVPDPAGAIVAQMALEPILVAMEEAGSITGFQAYYGANRIVVMGGPGSVQLLAGWPGVAALWAAGASEVGFGDHVATGPQATGHITGQVSGTSGGLGGIRVTAYWQTGPTSWSVAGTASTNASGLYDVSGLPTGIYRVKFEDLTGGYVTEFYNDKSDFALANNLDVTDGQTTANINATLALAGKIAGVVTGPSGGIADIVASAWAFSGGVWKLRGSEGTASDGRYTIGGLAPGTYRVKFSDVYDPPRYVEEWYDNASSVSQAADVAVSAGQTTSNINATLGDYGRITGQVTAPDGVTPLKNITVDAYRYDGGWQLVSFASTDDTGLYELAGLTTANYRVGFTDAFGQFAAEYYNDKPDLAQANDIAVTMGSVTAGINATLDYAIVTRSRSLPAGWNLMSLPVTPVDMRPEAVFAGIAGSYNLAYAYNGCAPADPWQRYDPAAPPFANTLTSIDARKGIWLRTTAPVSLSVTGSMPLSTQMDLCTGWNLIGFPAVSARPLTTVLAGIAGKYDLVYAYDASDVADPWKKYDPNAPPFVSDLSNMSPWTGYWLRMTQPATLTISSR